MTRSVFIQHAVRDGKAPTGFVKNYNTKSRIEYSRELKQYVVTAIVHISVAAASLPRETVRNGIGDAHSDACFATSIGCVERCL